MWLYDVTRIWLFVTEFMLYEGPANSVLRAHIAMGARCRADFALYLIWSVCFSDAASTHPSPFGNVCIVVLLHVIFAMLFSHARSHVSGGRGANDALSPLLFAVALNFLTLLAIHVQ